MPLSPTIKSWKEILYTSSPLAFTEICPPPTSQHTAGSVRIAKGQPRPI